MGKAGMGGGGGATAPSAGGSSASMPGMHSSAASQSASNNMSTAIKAQALEAGRPTTAGMQQAANAPSAHVKNSPELGGKWEAKSAGAPQTTAQAVAQSSQTYQAAGGKSASAGEVAGHSTSPSSQAEQAKIQTMLENSAKTGQNTPRADAVQQAAKDAPRAEAPSSTMQK